MKDGELLTEIRLPIRPGGGSAYEKVGRRAGDWALAAAGAAVWIDGGKVTDVGIGLTAVGARAFFAVEAEEYLRGARPTDETFAEAGADRRRALRTGRRPARSRRLQAASGRRATDRALRTRVARGRGQGS